MKLTVLTPSEKLFSSEVNKVTLPGSDGLFTILKNHAPMIAKLKNGKIVCTDENNVQHTIEISGGLMRVLKNEILVLVK